MSPGPDAVLEIHGGQSCIIHRVRSNLLCACLNTTLFDQSAVQGYNSAYLNLLSANYIKVRGTDGLEVNVAPHEILLLSTAHFLHVIPF